METKLNTTNTTSGPYSLQTELPGEIASFFNNTDELRKFFHQFRLPTLDELFANHATPIGKKNFLVFKHNKYINIPTENIAFFYVRYESSVIMCFDKQEYFAKYSLEQIQNLLPPKQFFRLNRQYLVSFHAVKEVEHYRARKLLINPVIPPRDQLLVPKRKVSEFLHWLDNR